MSKAFTTLAASRYPLSALVFLRAMAFTGLAMTALADSPAAQTFDVGGYGGIELRFFPDSALLAKQKQWNPSVILSPQYKYESDENDYSFIFEPFLRIDGNDSKRTHFDVRQLLWSYQGNDWLVSAGFGKVFWGTAESVHLIDIVNQTDFVEDIDGEAKLGQPMIRFVRYFPRGSVELFALVGARERTFPSQAGRLWLPVDTKNMEFRSSRTRVDSAARVTYTLGSLDIGLSWFHGIRREPAIVFTPDSPLATLIYDEIDQFSVDAQGVWSNLLFKLEAFYRLTAQDDYPAVIGGIEYLLSSVLDTRADLSLMLEYVYDQRRNSIETAFQNDLFIGSRLALNDYATTSILAGIITDMEQDSLMWRIEASRRLGDRWRLSLDLQGFPRTNQGEPIHFWRRDGHARIQLQHFF